MAFRKKDSLEEEKKSVRQLKRSGDKTPSTQRYLPFAEIRDNLVIMRDGTLRAVILVSSLNFALKSEDEQKGTVQAYVSFLNTIDFPLQIVVQSRKLNIEKYLNKLELLARQQDNELLRKQTLSYRMFVKRLVEEADIMDKKFYVVVQYSPISNKKKSFWSRARDVLSTSNAVRLNQKQFQQYVEQLERRIAVVISGLRSMSLETQVLDTAALIEMYYNTYNPVTKQRQRIEDMDKLQIDWTAH